MPSANPVRHLAALFVLSALAACSGNGLSAIDSAFLAGSASWDVNKNGVVTCEDWKNYLSSLFTIADANRDGVLTREEFASFSQTDRMFDSANFDYWDMNKDGKLTLAEMQQKPNPAFVLADTNKDCRLETAELVAARNIGQPKPFVAPPEAGKGSGMPGQK